MSARRTWTVARLVWLELLRRKDAYVLAILLAALLLALISLDVFGLGHVTGYVKDMGLLGCWLLGWILAIQTGVRQLPQEESRGTVFALLAKPVSRWELVLGKWLGAWIAVVLALLAFYALLAGIVLLRGGALAPGILAQAILLHAVALGIVTALAVALSTRLTAEAAGTLAYVLTGSAFLLLPRVPTLVQTSPGVRGTLLLALYYLLPHFELFDLRRRLLHGFGPLPVDVTAKLVAYGAVWTGALLVMAGLSYRRRRFRRDRLAE